MKIQKVENKYIQRIVEGLTAYYNHMINTDSFSPSELKNFMEPHFEASGYRCKLPAQGGQDTYFT